MPDETNELKFVCQFCGKAVDAHPDMMIESEVNIYAVDENGNTVELSSEQKDRILKEASEEDHELGLFANGAVCMCVECQEKMMDEADEVTEIEEEKEE